MKKADYHLHAARSGLIEDFEIAFNCKVDRITSGTIHTLEDMQLWINKNIHTFANDVDGWIKRIELMFLALEKDCVVYAEPSFTLLDILRFSSFAEFMNTIDSLRTKHDKVIIAPVLSFSRAIDPENIIHLSEKIISYGWFKSIDLCNNELLSSAEKYKALYEIAEAYGLKKKAHVGEFGSAQDVLQTIKVLRLDEVQHGISVASDASIMKKIANMDLKFNVCPASNIFLGITPSYSEHPIGEMYRAGLNVTINTDDLLVFDSSLTDQYEQLLRNHVFTEEELADIASVEL